MRILVNGHQADSVSIADRGLQYGDGVFETIAVLDGVPLLRDRHIRRLIRGAEMLGLPAPDAKQLDSEIAGISAGADRAVVKILLTAGAGGRGYSRPSPPTCNRIVSLHPFPDHPPSHWSRGVCVHVCETRLALQPRLAGIKHCNRLEQILARREWDDPEIAEGLMLDTRGWLAEGTMSNVFAARQGRLLTPALTECGVHGVMREAVIGLAAGAGIPVERVDAPLEKWLDVDEMFLTNSIIGLWPVRKMGDRALEPGPLGRLLRQRLADAGLAAIPALQGG